MPIRRNNSNFVTIKDKAIISCPSARFSSLGDGKQDVIEILCSKDNKFKTSQNNANLHEYQDLSCSRLDNALWKWGHFEREISMLKKLSVL